MEDAATQFIAAGDVAGLRAWLDAGGDVNHENPANNQTLLIAATFEGQHDIVRLLLERGGEREGALVAAILGQHGVIARELLSLGCDRHELQQANSIHRQVSEGVPVADEELGRLLRAALRAAKKP
ncbi:MAG: ankyrin repeat domain-containing protein [Planctomycetes bacterium]|nr:ankyrin repeat domain-containing protein [Planctomycetota bacterium]